MANEVGHYPREESLNETQMEICQRIMLGESVRAITADDHMPSRSAVLNWLASDPVFRTAYTYAKQLQAETLVEEALEIADDATGDYVDTPNGKVFDSQHVQRAKLRVDVRKWAAGKLAPKRYGDASTIHVGDLDGRPTDGLNENEKFARLAALARELEKRSR